MSISPSLERQGEGEAGWVRGSGREGIYDYKRKAVWKKSFRLIGIVDIEGRERPG